MSSVVRRPLAGALVYVLMLVGGVGLFFLIRAVGESLSTPTAPTGDVPVAASAKPGRRCLR